MKGVIMKKLMTILIAVLALSLMACAPKTTIVLTKDDDGYLGKVEVKAASKSQVLSGAQEYTEATDTLSPVKVMDDKTLQANFGAALAAQPEKTASFLIFFKPDSVELTPDSKQQIPGIAETIKKRKNAVISIIGHTDTTGTDALNMALSQSRAEAVAKILVEQGLSRAAMTLQYFGKNDLLVPTADNVPEPRNRRVEIFLR